MTIFLLFFWNFRHLTIDSAKTDMKRVVGLICGCCQSPISADLHVDHLKSIVHKRWSHMNTWDSWFQQFEMDYLRTKVIFSNGLIVFKQNLVATDLGGSPGYKNLARELFKALKYHWKKNRESWRDSDMFFNIQTKPSLRDEKCHFGSLFCLSFSISIWNDHG